MAYVTARDGNEIPARISVSPVSLAVGLAGVKYVLVATGPLPTRALYLVRY